MRFETFGAAMDELETDLSLMKAVGREAADLALDFQRRGFTTYTKADGSPVTDADLAVNGLLLERLQTARPDYGWLSEECVDGHERLTREHTWIVDPIDGTRGFLRGSDEWVVALALARQGRVVASVVVNPMRGQLFEAVEGGGARLNDEAVKVSYAAKLESSRVSISDGLRPATWPPMKPVLVGSTIYRFALTALGEIDGMLALKSKWEWDVAAGALLVSEAGGVVTSSSADPLIFNTASAKVQGFVAAAPVLHQIMIEHVAGTRAA